MTFEIDLSCPILKMDMSAYRYKFGTFSTFLAGFVISAIRRFWRCLSRPLTSKNGCASLPERIGCQTIISPIIQLLKWPLKNLKMAASTGKVAGVVTPKEKDGLKEQIMKDIPALFPEHTNPSVQAARMVAGC